MPAAGLFHALLESHGPARHPIVEARAGFGARRRTRAIFHAFRRVFDEIVLIARDIFALLPNRRADGAVGMDRIVRPVAAPIIEIEPAREGPRDDFLGE